MGLRLLLKSLLMPPMLQLTLIACAAFFYRRYPRLSKFAFYLGFGGLWLLSTPLVSSGLAQLAETRPALSEQMLANSRAQAIVILTAAQNDSAPEYGQAVSSGEGQLRARYGAYVHTKTGLPVLVSGGSVFGDDKRSLAETMAFDLRSAFRVEVQWLEKRSRTTEENARYSRELLAPLGIERVLLVTSATHMARAEFLFTHAGFTVESAPTAFEPTRSLHIRHLVPDSGALYTSSGVIHEFLGFVFAWLKYRAN